jgi:hypothetical protein
LTLPEQSAAAKNCEVPFQGLAPFLRMSIAGIDLRPIGQAMLKRANVEQDNADLWMALATIMLAMEVQEAGLAIQTQALAMKRVYHIAAAKQPAILRLLMLMVPGDLAANTPIECLLEDCDIDLVFYYLDPGDLFSAPVPEHDVVMVAISEAEEHRHLLDSLEQALANWPRPVINAARCIPATGRVAASELLQDVPGLLIPPTLPATRAQLQDIADGTAGLHELFAGSTFPVILRPVGSHGGHGLDKVTNLAEVSTYLGKVSADEFFLSRFIDYSGSDGLFRKCRVVLIDGAPYACHMGVSSHWMIHYVNAGMYEDAGKRAEEGAFMANFDEFVLRHGPALEAIYQRTGLDYVGIDCAEMADGELLVFEIGHAMVVHGMDLEELFAGKHIYIRKLRDAFRALLLRVKARRAAESPS